MSPSFPGAMDASAWGSRVAVGAVDRGRPRMSAAEPGMRPVVRRPGRSTAAARCCDRKLLRPHVAVTGSDVTEVRSGRIAWLQGRSSAADPECNAPPGRRVSLRSPPLGPGWQPFEGCRARDSNPQLLDYQPSALPLSYPW